MTTETARRAAAGVVMAGLLTLIALDLWIRSVELWWSRHSLATSIVANLLVLAVTLLIVDEVLAARRRRDRALSVAVQALIVYGQARRVWDAITGQKGTVTPQASDPFEESRTLASMLLTAAPNLFEDPEARRFLEALQRFLAALVSDAVRSRHGTTTESRNELDSAWSQLQDASKPLVARIAPQQRALLEGSA